MRSLTLVVALGFGSFTSACLHRGPESAAASPVVSAITRADIERVHARTALDAVQRLRPDVLTRRAPSSVLADPRLYPVVFINASMMGRVDELRNYAADDIEEIHIFAGSDAMTRFGSQYAGGVIQIIPRTGS